MQAGPATSAPLEPHTHTHLPHHSPPRIFPFLPTHPRDAHRRARRPPPLPLDPAARPPCPTIYQPREPHTHCTPTSIIPFQAARTPPAQTHHNHPGAFPPDEKRRRACPIPRLPPAAAARPWPPAHAILMQPTPLAAARLWPESSGPSPPLYPPVFFSSQASHQPALPQPASSHTPFPNSTQRKPQAAECTPV